MIYFLREGAFGPIKIGYTMHQDAEERLVELQTGNACVLRLLGTISGGLRTEADLHHLFARYHLRGEWFEPGIDLLNFIVKQGGQVDPVLPDELSMDRLLLRVGTQGIEWVDSGSTERCLDR